MRDNRVIDALARLSQMPITGAKILLVAMMLVTTVDVVGRYVFNTPLIGSNEIAELMQVCVVFFGVAYTAVKKGHVAIDLVFKKLSEGNQRFLKGVVALISTALFALIAWQSFVQSFVYKAMGRSSPVLQVSVWPLVLVVTFGSALLSIVLFKEFIDSLLEGGYNCLKIWLRASGAVLLTLSISAIVFWIYRLPPIDPIITGVLGFLLLLLLLLSGMPVGFALAIVGFLGASYIRGLGPVLGQMGRLPYVTPANYDWTSISLFVLMGFLAFHSGMGRNLYNVVYTWVGWLPGGLAIATIGGCAGFAAISGDSLSTAITMGTVSLPEMKAYRYSPSLATGSVAAGGTLGVLIPPSIVFIIYGMLTEQSIGRLFIAGIFPGILLSGLFMLSIYARCRLNLELGPPGPKTSFLEKLLSLRGTWEVILLFGMVIGGIYFGVFTPTEAAAIGASGALTIGLSRRVLTWQNFLTSVVESCKIIAMCFTILIGASIFSLFLSLTRLPVELANFVVGLGVPNLVILVLIYVIYILLGCVMPGIPLIILTVPIFYPVVMALGYDPIWFGVVIVLIIEMAVITPPVGINVYGIAGVAKDVPMETIFRGILPFFLMLLLALAIITALPQIATFLPSMMK